jgi:hypothetical protein
MSGVLALGPPRTTTRFERSPANLAHGARIVKKASQS